MDFWEFMRIRGIPLRIHPSWLLIFIIFSWTAQQQIASSSEVQLPFLYSWCIGLITSSLLFLSVLLHELGHSFMALREGVKVVSITLFFLGGVATVEKECITPMGNFRIAFAGPIVSLLISLLLFSSVNYFHDTNPIFINIINQIASLNLILGLFNLLPGLPLDGGIMLKSLVWYFTGSKRKGIQVAISSGRFLAILAMFLGIWLSFSGAGFAGLWLLFLGWLGFSSARSQSQLISLQKALCKLKVINSCSRRYRVFDVKLPLRKISKIRNISKNDLSMPFWYLICDSGRWIGYLNDIELKDIPVQYWENYTVSDFTKPLNELPRISANEPLWKAILELEKSKEGRLLVFNLAGLPFGTLDRVDIGKSVLKDIGLSLPDQFFKVARKKNIYPLGLSMVNIVNNMISSGLVED